MKEMTHWKASLKMNPYENRRIGGQRTQATVNASKSKCPVCSKGFNSRSNFVSCHACDKPTHVKCIQRTYAE